MTIQFAQVPASIRTPGKYLEFNNSLALRNLPTNRMTLLLVGQVNTGTVPPAGLNVAVQVFDTQTADTYFGAGSQLSRMVAAAIKANPYCSITCLPVADPVAGVAATSAIVAAGGTAPTVAGTVYFYIAGKAYQIAAAITDTVATVLQALGTAITADPSSPAAASWNAGSSTLTLTAKNTGLEGNHIALSCDPGNTGFVVTIPAMAGGTGTVVLTTALANVFPTRYNCIVSGWSDATTIELLRDHVNSAGGAMEMRGQRVFCGSTDTIANATAIATALNAERVTIGVCGGSPSTPSDIAAAYAAVRASEEDPAMPLDTLALPGIVPPAAANRYTRTEKETMLYAGLTPLEVGPGELVQIVRAISTYTLNAQGVDDWSYLDIETVDTLDYIRDAVRTRWANRFGRSKLNDSTIAKVWSETYSVLLSLEDLEVVENVEANKATLQVSRNLQDPNRLDVAIPSDIVTGLHVLAGVIYLIL